MNNNSNTQLNVFTGGETPENWLKPKLKSSIKTAKRIDLIVSFLMESGVRLLLDDLKDAIDRNIPIRILTGNYLNITEPSALYLLKKELNDKADIRFFNNPNKVFHPKAYIFEQEGYDEIFIGSSNLSKSALTEGIEWNYRLDSRLDQNSADQFKSTFNDLFENHSLLITDNILEEYSKNWHRPQIYKDIEKLSEDDSVIPLFQPRGFQIEALSALNNSRNEGATKALVEAATGTGKTFLAAFDSKDFNKILFVAHRNEILEQAADTFKKVSDKTQGFFTGKEKQTDEDIIFASVSTLGQPKYLNPEYFKPDEFSYIVIDEFHHAVASQYQRILDYFKPDFLLGLTATPERLDQKNIYELCNYNLPYQINLFEAINKGLLVPFHYYGIYDETDHSQVKIVNGHFDTKALNEIYINNIKRNNLILNHYLKHSPGRTLGFCPSKEYAESMAEFFNQNGIPAVAVYSGIQGEYALNRDIALEKLRNGEIKVIFSIDMFNEGLDVPDIDCVLFLRPTQSPTIFFQQLGRGLRKSKNKDYLTVLDFLGNYKNVFQLPNFLTNKNLDFSKNININQLDLPDDCFVDFDLTLVDLFNKMRDAQKSRLDRIVDEYYRIKESLGHRPSRSELFLEMDPFLYEECFKLRASQNPFKSYLNFLKKLDELSPEEEELTKIIANELITLFENTNMTKVYKMPVLSSFLGEKTLIKEPSEEQILTNWKNFFRQNKNYRDLSYLKTLNDLETIPDKKHLSKIKQMPIHFLIHSGKGLFEQTENGLIALSSQLDNFLDNSILIGHLKDIIKYRTMEYYKRRYEKN